MEVGVGELDVRESQDERDDNTEDGDEHGALSDAEELLDLGLQTDREQEEYHSDLGSRIQDGIIGAGVIASRGRDLDIQEIQESVAAYDDVCYQNTYEDLTDQSGDAEVLEDPVPDTCQDEQHEEHEQDRDYFHEFVI